MKFKNSFLVFLSALVWGVAAPAQDVGETTVHDRITAALRARAERPPERASPGASAVAGGVPSPAQLFSMTGPDNSPCVRAVPDVNNDGRDEIVVGIDESGTDNIFLIDGASSGTATALWSIETLDGVSGGSPWGEQALEVVADSNGNGTPNILLGTAWGGRTAYNLDAGDGSVVWKFDTYLAPESGWVYSLAQGNDVSGDGVPEVVFGVGSMNDGVYMVDGAASAGQAPTRWRYQASDGVLSVRNVGDVNGDGDHDFLAAIGDFGDELVCLDGGTLLSTGNELWDYPGGATVYAAGALPDISGDGVSEALAVVWVSGGSAVRCLNGATGGFLWQTTTVLGSGMMVDLLADVTGDGTPEIVVSSWENAVSVIDGSDGTQVWKTTVGTLNGGDVWTARAIGDLNGDGFEDVIAGSFDYHVYAMDGRDGEILWAFDTGNRVYSVYPVGDLDGDGRPEVAVGTQDTNSSVVFHVLSGGVAVPVFSDGFESGDAAAWTVTTVGP